MDYQKTYDRIIENARNENRVKRNGIYFENHHVIPKCLNGNNKKENLVLLTAREHFVCHKLLTYIFKGNRKIAYAFHLMTFMNKRKYRITSRDYAYARELLILIPISEETKEKRRKPRSEETKEKIRKTLTGIKLTQERIYNIKINTKIAMQRSEVKQKIKENRPDRTGDKNPFFEKQHSQESRKKMSKNHTGKHHSEKTKQKIKESLKKYYAK